MESRKGKCEFETPLTTPYILEEKNGWTPLSTFTKHYPSKTIIQ
jgi:hypothetical protein